MGGGRVAVRDVDGHEPDAPSVAEALAVLRAGELIVYPTDTLYALGCRALDPEAVRRLRQAKGREEGKPLPLVCADLEQARSLADPFPAAAERLALSFWPGPLTLVLAASARVPEDVTAGGSTVAMRVPALELVRRLCAGAGPLVSTSANAAGEPPPLTCQQALAALGGRVVLALDGGAGRPEPSTIVDLTGGEPRLVRAGAVEWEQVRRLLR